ncbi:MAG: outer membrane beta-barrel protein [Candidatus Devosia phytovorans]|uniref:Outer membrane beta-barrel protein n=1 Tax=Candidatus Devosia phytovorans TaxID=3121372 RepID=A0AAJ5VR57_9HYPH|nr:outer membrane beta-barrel protein [Devosia sp.]WEK03223.1 MAG: outer membrane beta-barrel protein [Devosia sp.]
MIRLTALLLATAAISTPALAADFYGNQTAAVDMYQAPASDWTGFYVGGFAGGAFNPSSAGVIEIDEDLDGDFSEPLAGPLAAAFGSNFIGSHDGGFLGGIEAGYDHQMGQFVVGGVIDIGYVDFQDRQSGFSSTPASYTQVSELGWLGTIRARGGYLVTEDVLAYVHGGLAIGDTSFSFESTNPNGVSRGGSSTSVGFQVGAGVEAKIQENWSVGVEYAYTNLGDTDFTTRFANGPFAGVNPAGADLRGSDDMFDFHTVKATLKYRF